jgi:hypothetical protein
MPGAGGVRAPSGRPLAVGVKAAMVWMRGVVPGLLRSSIMRRRSFVPSGRAFRHRHAGLAAAAAPAARAITRAAR